MTRVGCPKGISWHFRKTESPQTEKSFSCCPLTSQPTRPRFMKEKSVQVPALKDLLDRPLDLGCAELMEQAMRDAVNVDWSSNWGHSLRSLKRHSSSPEHVLDLLFFLNESSDEKMHKMDLDVTVTMGQVAAARRALREAIHDVELAVKKGETWNCRQSAPWLHGSGPCVGPVKRNGPWWCLGTKDLPILRATEGRASTLMITLPMQRVHIQVQQLTQECTRLKEEESKRQEHASQMRQLQLECENLRKRQEEHESERLKERRAVALKLQELRLECEHLRKKQEENESERLKEESQRQEHALQMQQLQSDWERLRKRKRQEESECERLKKESKRQAVAVQLQQIQIECETLKNQEFEFKSLVAAAQSLKSKVEQFCNECEKCDAEDVLLSM